MASKFSYVGPQTSINIPAENPGGESESILLVGGAIVELPERATQLPQVQRYQRRGMLSKINEPKPRRSGRRAAATETEAD